MFLVSLNQKKIVSLHSKIKGVIMGLLPLIEKEKETIYNTIVQKTETKLNLNKDHDKLNSILESISIDNIHLNIIDNLIYTYFYQKDKDNAYILTNNLLCNKHNGDFEFYEGFKTNEIPTLCEEFHLSYLNSWYKFTSKGLETKKSKSHLLEKGAVYTQKKITSLICTQTLKNIESKGEGLKEKKFLDFACGTGRFYEELILQLLKKGLDINDIILNNLYAFDLDPVAINTTRLKAIIHLKTISLDKVKIIAKNILLRNGLVRSNIMFTEKLCLRHEDFNGLLRNGFDAIVSNPPYLVLKPNKRKMSSAQAERISKQVCYFRTCGDYQYSIEGMLNLYQLSLESMLKMLKAHGELGIICPSTLFADKSASSLRRYFIERNNLREIIYFPEKEELFENVTQATVVFFLEKNGKSSNILFEDGGSQFVININWVKDLFPKYLEIPRMSEEDWEILRKLNHFKKLKDFNYIRNKRGELDLSINNSFITKERTPYRLVRGNMLSGNSINDINGEYVREEFLASKSETFKKYDVNRVRLISPQISNAGKLRRLHFIYCETFDVLGNSCNYISSDNITLKKLKLILNSSLLDWRFKLTSSNNHINNYELDDLPICDLESIDPNFTYDSQSELDDYICKKYGLTKNEINYIKGKYYETI